MPDPAPPAFSRLYDTIHNIGEPWVRPGLALIFDMDGVIVDSNPLHRKAWTIYNARFGVSATGLEQRMYGRRNDEIVRDFFGVHLSAAEIAAHGAAKESLYRELLSGRIENHLVPGVRTFLARHASIPMALATNAEPANVRFLLDGAGIAGYFRVVVDGHQVERPKPAPDIYLEAAVRLGIKSSDCIVFEDSHSGVRASLAAGMRTVGVRTTHEVLEGVHFAIADFEAPGLEKWLRLQLPTD